MSLSFHIDFNGQCEEAFSFYAKHLGGKIGTMLHVKSYFNALQGDGQVILAPQRTFWSPCYAIVIDRFGVPWKINYGA
jgi:PhnB protein